MRNCASGNDVVWIFVALQMFAGPGLGFLLGMRHALEADHIAAIGATTIYATAFA